MQTIQQLEARALHRADQVDELDRKLIAAKEKRRADALRGNRPGFAKLKRLFLPDRSAEKIEKLEREVVHARNALRIALAQLHMAHCEQLRSTPGHEIPRGPSEAERRAAVDEYHPWNRVQMAGKRALAALTAIGDAGDFNAGRLILLGLAAFADSERGVSDDLLLRIEAANRAGWEIRAFLNSLQMLKQERPEADVEWRHADLAEIASELTGIRTRFTLAAAQANVRGAARMIAAAMDSQRQASATQVHAFEDMHSRLEEVNHQIALAAWSKIPARLRPPGR